MSRHLVVDLSAHGFGHVAQTAPVVNALARRLPDLAITIRSAAPADLLASRFSCGFTHLAETLDFGMVMGSALEVKAADSAAAYRALHGAWDRRVAAAAERLAALAPDAVLANVPYLSLAAAARARIPAVALCSLNWADIFFPYCREMPEAGQIQRHMLDAYNSARVFLRVEPAMPMTSLTNARAIGPVARLGVNRREAINARLGLPPGRRLVLAAMGGIPFRPPVERWPRLPGITWLAPAAWASAHPDMVPLESLAMPFTDLLASCDALLTKPGYGSFAEAACNGVPVLTVRRADWPEEPYLVAWLRTAGCCREITLAQLEAGDLAGPLAALPAQRPAPVAPLGVAQAADYLAALLASS